MKKHVISGLLAMLAMTGAATAAEQFDWTAKICRSQTTVDRVVLLAGTSRETRTPYATWEKSVPLDTFELPSALQSSGDLSVDFESQSGGSMVSCVFSAKKPDSGMVFEISDKTDDRSSRVLGHTRCPC